MKKLLTALVIGLSAGAFAADVDLASPVSHPAANTYTWTNFATVPALTTTNAVGGPEVTLGLAANNFRRWVRLDCTGIPTNTWMTIGTPVVTNAPYGIKLTLTNYLFHVNLPGQNSASHLGGIPIGYGALYFRDIAGSSNYTIKIIEGSYVP